MSSSAWRGAVFVAVLAIPAAVAAGEDAMAKGKALHQQHCLSCHDTGVYTRPDRVIHSLGQLEAQVARCAAGPASVDWNGDQIQAVTQYLDKSFYGFSN